MATKTNPDIINNNPLLDTSKTTTDAYVALKRKGFLHEKDNHRLGVDDTKWYNSPVMKAQVYVYTPLDNQQHKYWTSMNIDVQIQDFMGTCELRAPYDSDLMAYWQPIAQICIVYGSNNGPAKVLFVGRVREVKQDGYECVVTLQNYGWKFQQDAPANFVQDNVTNKDGLTILKNIFEVLKIKGYTISENAAKRLQEVGINSDGNLTLNGKEVTEMPDLLDRLKALNKADMTKIMGKQVITEKEKEDQINWADVYKLNYTLRYSEPTAAMTKLNNSSNYSSGKNVYNNNYASAGTNTASTASQTSTTPVASPNKGTSSQWTAIAVVVQRVLKVTEGKQNQYIRRLMNAGATWSAIAHAVNGHPIKPEAKKKGWTQNIAIRTIYYINRDNLSADKAIYNAFRDEKISKGDVRAALQRGADNINEFVQWLGLGSLWK